MRNLFAMIGLAVVGFGGLGWYLGWYKLAVQAGTDGTQRISVDVDTKKIAADVKAGGQAVGDFVDDKNKKADAAKDEVKEGAKKVGEAFVGPPSPFQVNGSTDGVTIQFPQIKIGGHQTRDRE